MTVTAMLKLMKTGCKWISYKQPRIQSFKKDTTKPFDQLKYEKYKNGSGNKGQWINKLCSHYFKLNCHILLHNNVYISEIAPALM